MLYRFYVPLLLFMMAMATVAHAQEPQPPKEKEEKEPRDFDKVRKGSGILDDSTTMVYGPTTSTFTHYENIKFNQEKYFTIDTLLLDMERMSYRDRQYFTYQDLGNNGTALWPTFYTPPTRIGLQAGFHAYDPFVRNARNIRYFDTKSPFIDLNVGLGGQGRSTVGFDFSRNVNPQWNIGFDIHRLASDKQIGAIRNEGDRNAEGSVFDIYSFYRSKNDKYTHLVSVSSFNHSVRETGGVFVGDDTTRVALYQYRDAIIKHRSGRNFDKRMHLHQYHQYKYKEFIEVYLETDVIRQRNSYEDGGLGTAKEGYYGNFLIRTDSTLDASDFKEIQNEIGIKGDVAKFFYNIYLKRRDMSFSYRFYDPLGRRSENYLGGRLRFDLNEKNSLDGQVELMQTGNYRLKADLLNDFFKASYTSALYMPTILQNNFFGNHYEWSNDFASVFTNELKGMAIVDLPFISIRPNITLTTLNNYIYFGEDKLPAQAGSGILLSTYGLELAANANKLIFLKADARYTNVGGGSRDLLRIPELFVSGKLYYEGAWFNSYMPIMIGTNVYYRSGYYGNDYDPITQQFFLQNNFLLESYLAADLFINIRVDRVRLFFKMTHINQSANNDGYMVSPFYPGQERIFDLGFRWLFFD